MKIYTSQGIIFRTLKYSESSIICDIYTREKGMRSFIVSGVRTSKSGAKAAIYQHLNIVELVSFDVDSDKLSRIKEIRLAHHFQEINRHVVISSMAIFILEICRQGIKEKECNTDLFDFLYDWFLVLDDKKNYHPCIHLLFLIELSGELGFGPMNNYSPTNIYFDMSEGLFSESFSSINMMNVEESQAFSRLIDSDKNTLHELHFPKSVRDHLTDRLVTYFKLHIDGFKDLNSLEVLRNVL